MYNTGQGVEQNFEQAVSWYREAAKLGDSSAQCNLGHMTELGQGLEQNLELAVSWYREAATQGNLEGQRHLGTCLKHGNGVEKDADAAVTWFREAAKAGHAEAQSELASCYALGTGVGQNDALAVEWWAKAVQGGDVVSRYNIGAGYMHGVYGLPKDVERAKAFMKSAATRGCTEAIEALKVLGRCAMELDPGQCVSCGAPDITRTCLGYRRVRYCTLACQDRDWASHMPDCGGLKAYLCFSCTSKRPVESNIYRVAARMGEGSTALAAAAGGGGNNPAPVARCGEGSTSSAAAGPSGCTVM
jgi:hypothetical protein